MNGNDNGNGSGSGNGTTALLELIAEKLDVLKSIDRRVESIDRRVESIDRRVESIDGRLENVEHRLENVEHRLENVEHKLDSVVEEQAKTNRRLDHMIVFMGGKHSDHEERIAALESAVFKKSG